LKTDAVSGLLNIELLQDVNSAADGSLRLALRVKINKKKYYNFFTTPIFSTDRTSSYQFSCKIQVIAYSGCLVLEVPAKKTFIEKIIPGSAIYCSGIIFQGIDYFYDNLHRA